MSKFYKAPYYTEEQLEEMEERDIKHPFTSKYMRYCGIKRQYIPTEALLLKHGINISEFLLGAGKQCSPTNIEEELEYISDQIYSYCNKNSGSNVETIKCIIAKGLRRGISPFRFRVMFEEILWKQARFYLGNDDHTKLSGMDVEQKQHINKSAYLNEDRHIDPKLKISLMDLGLTWVGSYDNMFAGYVYRQDW